MTRFDSKLYVKVPLLIGALACARWITGCGGAPDAQPEELTQVEQKLPPQSFTTTYYNNAAHGSEVGECILECNGHRDCWGSTSPYKVNHDYESCGGPSCSQCGASCSPNGGCTTICVPAGCVPP